MTLYQFCYEVIIIGLLTFGGGNNIIPMAKKIFVEKYKMISDEELMEIVIVTNALPGPSMVEIIGFIGKKFFGNKGLILGSCLIVLPASIIMYLTVNIIFKFWQIDLEKYMFVPIMCVIAMSMINLGFNDLVKKQNFKFIVIFSLSLILMFLNVPISIIMIVMIISVFYQNWRGK